MASHDFGSPFLRRARNIASWDSVLALLSEGLLTVNGWIVKPVIELIHGLIAHGANERYFASQSHERMAILPLGEKGGISMEPHVLVTPHEDGTLTVDLYDVVNEEFVVAHSERCTMPEAVGIVMKHAKQWIG